MINDPGGCKRVMLASDWKTVRVAAPRHSTANASGLLFRCRLIQFASYHGSFIRQASPFVSHHFSASLQHAIVGVFQAF
jgi:hypothetical protein